MRDLQRGTFRTKNVLQPDYYSSSRIYMVIKLQNSTALGLILGSNKINLKALDSFTGREVDTDFGKAFVLAGTQEKLIILPRHGKNSNIPPHEINHHANMLAFKKLGVEKIISFTSVGSLKVELKPGHIVLPDDYIDLGKICTYFDNKIHHIIPGMDDGLREQIFNKIKQMPFEVKYNAIYIQTQGPRLETKAEIQMLKNFGDIVGMTMAAEATLAKELGLGYANISIIGNYCNGLIEKPLTIEILKENQTKDSENILKIIRKLLK